MAQASTPSVVRLALRQDTGPLDSAFIVGHVMEGLVSMKGGAEEGEKSVVPGVAESWSEEGNEIIFHLRKNAHWSNGAPVTAHDFISAWRHLLDDKGPPNLKDRARFLFPFEDKMKRRRERHPSACGSVA